MALKDLQKIMGLCVTRILLKAKDLPDLPPKFFWRPAFFTVVLNAYRAVALAQSVAIRAVPQGGMLHVWSRLS